MAAGGERVQPITIVSPLRRWWAWWLLGSWPGARRVAWIRRPLQRPLLRLGFIHFAHWAVVMRVPASAGRRRARRLRRPCLIFQSNFDGQPEAYIDAFADAVPWRMWALWGGAYEFPGPQPSGRFRRLIAARSLPTGHYWCAYPQATSRMIVAALALQARFDRFEAEARGLGEHAFAAAWEALLTDAQKLL